MSNDRRQGTTIEGNSDMQKVTIIGAVFGCVFAFPAVYVCANLDFFKPNVELYVCHIFTVLAIVGAVASGTEAIHAKLDQIISELSSLRRSKDTDEGVEKP